MIAELAVADGSKWSIAADDRRAAALLEGVVEVMSLRWAEGPITPLITLVAESSRHETSSPIHTSVEQSAVDVVCRLQPTGDEINDLIGALRAIVGVVGRHVQRRGGMLVHSALAESAGRGVALAGRGGIGKTTASLRLPPPWHSLCDDATMIVRDGRGVYWAHPLPTASQFTSDGRGGSCNFRQAVPLHAVFFLDQSPDDCIEPMRGVAAVGRLLEVGMQAAGPAEDGQRPEQVLGLRSQLFDNACALVKTVPTAVLHLSLNGAFWLKIEQVISQKT